MQVENNKRIAKNTLFLYLRTFVTLVVSLYTSRVILNVLGVVDFGLFNVVGGIVTMLSFINSTMSAGTQRFLSFELGTKNFPQLKKTFSALLTIHILIALIIFILAETIGMWFLTNHLVIPPDRMVAAKWVFHFSVLSAVLTITQVPYNSSIIAHERMKAFAYIGVFQVALKLLIVFMLTWFGFDKLKLYSVLYFILILGVTIVYRRYCKINFDECKYKFEWDKNLFKTLLSYSSWNTFGGLAFVLVDQGVNMLLNIFFGPAINAARGIAIQVKSATSTFVGNFQTAVNPQIVKTYANNEHQYFLSLIYKSAKYSFFLLFLLTFPIIAETKFILTLWLKNVPDYAIIFCQLILINAIIDSMSGPLITAVQATGKIKIYQITVGTLMVAIFPLSYLALRLTNLPESTLYVSIVMSIIILSSRIVLLQRLMDITFTAYIKNVILKVLLVVIIPIPLTLIVRSCLGYGLVRFVTVLGISFSMTIISIYLFGLDLLEKKIIKNYAIKIIDKQFYKKENRD